MRLEGCLGSNGPRRGRRGEDWLDCQHGSATPEDTGSRSLQGNRLPWDEGYKGGERRLTGVPGRKMRRESDFVNSKSASNGGSSGRRT